MGKVNGRYTADYPVGTWVKVAPWDDLDHFLQTWAYHHKLEIGQLEYANVVAQVESVGYYHGGYELYKLVDVPGIWHETCLILAEQET